MGVIGIKIGGEPTTTMELTHLLFVAFYALCGFMVMLILLRYWDTWQHNRRDDSQVCYVLALFCTKKYLQKVQDEIDELEAAVVSLREDYSRQQAEKLRENFIRAFHAAKKVNPQFKDLFKIIEEELGATVHKELSKNSYGLPEDVIMSVTIENLPTFSDYEIKAMVGRHSSFKISESELPGLKSCVTILVGYKAERDRIGKIVVDAT